MNQAVDAQSFAPMECQAVNGQSIAHVEYQAVNLLDSGYAGDASQGQTASYLPSTGSEAASWTANGVDSQSTDKGVLSNSTYNHGQQTEQPIRNVQDGQNVTSTANPSTLGSENAYNSFASYSNSVDPYGYGGSGYQGYYNGYQQQSAHSYTQQQPNQTYSQPQPNYSYSQQQPIHSYSQPLGAYQNTGAPHQPLSSFQNSGFYAGTANYSSTYYNTADYQTAGGYPSSGYSNQSTPWNTGTHASYTSSQYTNYTSHTSGHISGSAASTSVNYQQHYKQWADYYSQTQVICAPGTEHLSSSSTPNQGSSASSGYAPSNNQPAPSPTPLWRPESTPSGLTSLQPAASSSGAHDGYWKQGAPNLQNQFASPVQPVFQNELDSKATYDNFQEQRKPSLQGSNLLYPVVNQVTPSYQSPQQTLPSLDTRKVGKFQIPTNPRIASNLTFGSSKPNKEGSAAGAATKPAYVGVSVPKPNNKVLWDDASNSMLKPGVFPQSLRRYVERAFLLCKDDAQRAACQGVMKEIITKATADGTLNTRDWDAEPLFPLPKPDVVDMETSQFSTPVTSFANKRSSTRRSKSRWEPLPDEKPVDKPVPANNDTTINCGGWDRKPLSGNSMSKDGTLNSIRFSLSDQKTGSKISQRPLKRQRLADVLSDDSGDASSNSDKEHSLTAYKSGPIPLANSPEEKRRRENRSRRFEKVHGHRVDFSDFKPKNAEVGNLYSKRASALMLSKSFDDGGSNAVEDINWDVLTVKGTCQEVEKRYLRLTSAPDPSTVRPEEVLEKALLMVQNSQKNYLYKCDQLKSIRQDLTVQRIRNELTVKVYETHARLALEVGDLPEYNQCQSQLKTLYAEGIEGCHMEFAAYNLLCVILHSNNNRDLLTSMSRLTKEARKDKAVKHALAVRAAVTSGNYVMFFRLYKMAPNLNTCLMDPSVEKMRYKAVSCMSRAYRPSIPVSYAAKILGFSSILDGNNEKGVDGLEECEEWLKAHGACITTDNNGELQLDTKASSSSLYMPEPEDAVAHGDANLAVNDFLARAPLSVAAG